MAVDSIETLRTREYSTNLALLSQQMQSKLRGLVMTGNHAGSLTAAPLQQYSATTVTEKTTRHQAAPFIPQSTARRWVSPKDWGTGDIVDTEDKLRMNIKPDGTILRNNIAGMNRKMDSTIIDAFFDVAKTDETGSTSTAFDSNMIVALSVGGADSGLNVDKIIRARRLVRENNVDTEDPMNQMNMAINAKLEEDLLQEIRFTNTDYQKDAILSGDGRNLKNFLGINIVMTELIEVDGSGNILVPFWCKSGMHLGIWQDIHGALVPRNDLWGDPKPVSIEAYGSFGATRLDEDKVAQIICFPT